MMRLYLGLEASRLYSSLLSKASSSLGPPEASHHRCHAGSGLFHIMLFLETVSHPSEAMSMSFKAVTGLCLRTELPRVLGVSRMVS